jgi:hypothetical protein
MNKKERTPLKAIRRYCRQECAGKKSRQGSAMRLAKACEDKGCPLWQFREGREKE